MLEMWIQSLGREDPRRREWQPTPVFLPGTSHGQRSLVGYSLCGCREVNLAKQLTHTCPIMCPAFQHLPPSRPQDPSLDPTSCPRGGARKRRKSYLHWLLARAGVRARPAGASLLSFPFIFRHLARRFWNHTCRGRDS